MSRVSLGATLLAACAAIGSARAADTPQAWLARMTQATAVEYRGVLVYVHDVLVIGDLPASTVERIAQTVEPLALSL